MTLKARYIELERERYEFVERAHKSAVLTKPSIFPREGQLLHQLPQNFQSVGSRGVASLSSKLGLTLFPPTLPFLRLEASESDLEALEAAGQGQSREEVEEFLHSVESEASSIFDTQGWRPAMADAFKLLVTTGNALLYDRPGGRVSTHNLHRYVVSRSAEGELLEVILKQSISLQEAQKQLEGSSIPAERLAGLAAQTTSSGQVPGIALFTGARRLPNGNYEYFEEIEDIRIGEPQELTESKLPLIPLRFEPIYGASYGRGYVEEYDGALLVLEKVSQALAEGSLALSKIIFLIRPGSSTKASALRAPNGSVKSGDGDDVSTIQAEKQADLSVALSVQQNYQTQLGHAFLLNSSIQRAGERVTAEEIRFVGQELEDVLGGVYSGLATTVQLPVVHHIVEKLGRIAEIPESVEFVIATGLESISRNHKAQKLERFLGSVGASLPPEELQTILKSEEIARQLATAYGLKASTIIRSDTEVAEARQEAQAQAAVSQLGAPAIGALTQ